MHRHLRGSVNLEAGIDLLNQAHDSDVLHYRSVDSPIDRFAKKLQRVLKLRRFYKRVECQVYPNTAGMRDPTCGLELIQRELRALIASIESLGAEVYGVGAIRDCCANGIERSCGGKKLRYSGIRGHPSI
jgi:hypothetical protein